MSDETIKVRYNSAPTIKRVMKDARNEADPEAVLDISAYDIKLIVKQDVELPDSRAWFDVDASVTDGLNGEYEFALTAAQTCNCPGTWPGEIRWWAAGYVAGTPPTDAISVDFVIDDVVDLP